jgi:hypothetical protein
MPKRRCIFTESLEAQYLFLKEDQKAGKELCSIFANHDFQYSMVILIYCNISRNENKQLLQKLKVAVKKQCLILPKKL